MAKTQYRYRPGSRRPLSSDELADLTEQFEFCDIDGDGRIGLAEFSQLLDALGVEIPASERQVRFTGIDLDRDGIISRDEFLEWWRGP